MAEAAGQAERSDRPVKSAGYTGCAAFFEMPFVEF